MQMLLYEESHFDRLCLPPSAFYTVQSAFYSQSGLQFADYTDQLFYKMWLKVWLSFSSVFTLNALEQ